MFGYDKATNYLESGVLGKLKADGRLIVANPSPNPAPPEGKNKPKPPTPSEPIGTTAERCRYCDASDEATSFIVSGYVVEDRKDNINMSAFLHGDTMIFSANFLTLEASINFCPMCGRKLSPHIIGATIEQGDDSE